MRHQFGAHNDTKSTHCNSQDEKSQKTIDNVLASDLVATSWRGLPHWHLEALDVLREIQQEDGEPVTKDLAKKIQQNWRQKAATAKAKHELKAE